MIDRQQETAVLVASDIHYGKATTTYNPDVFFARLTKLSQKMQRIRNLLGDYDFDKLVIMVPGDVNDGTGIYPTQDHHQAETNVEKQADEVSNLLRKFCSEQADVWGAVEVEAVPGNHGRAGRFAHEAANWDQTAYRYMKLGNRDDRVKINLDGADPFMRLVSIRNHGYLLYHGHDIPCYNSLPFYGIQMRAMRWYTAIEKWQTLVLGHFHTSAIWTLNNINIITSGTMVSDDEWALRKFGWNSDPRWWIFGVSNSRPITWQFRMDLA